jgi:hypothetical protein
MFPQKPSAILLVAIVFGRQVQAGVIQQADADQADGLTILSQTHTRRGRVTWYQDETLVNRTNISEVTMEPRIQKADEDDDWWWDECGDNWPIQCYNDHYFAALTGVCQSLRDFIANPENNIPDQEHHAVCMFYNHEQNCCVGYQDKVKGKVSMSKILHGFDDALHHCGGQERIGARVKNVELNGACK